MFRKNTSLPSSELKIKASRARVLRKRGTITHLITSDRLKWSPLRAHPPDDWAGRSEAIVTWTLQPQESLPALRSPLQNLQRFEYVFIITRFSSFHHPFVFPFRKRNNVLLNITFTLNESSEITRSANHRELLFYHNVGIPSVCIITMPLLRPNT